MASSVQFRGKDAVLKAVEYRKIAAWSFWSGRQLLHKYEGSDLSESVTHLDEFLDMIEEGTNAVYTLKFHEELKGGKITDKTPCDGSFNFRLNSDNQELNVGQYRQITSQNAILSELKALREDMDKIKEGGEDEEESDPMDRVIGRIIDHPMTSAVLSKILGIDPPQSLGKVGAIPGVSQSIDDSLKILKQHDPDIIEHLAKLSKIAEHRPKDFRFLLSMLDQISI